MSTTIKSTPTARQIETREINKADAAARLEYLQERDQRAHSLRQEFGYLGTTDTVLAMHWLAVAFQAEPSLQKWAASKTVAGRKPTPVELKDITVKWLGNPCRYASRGRVYRALTGGAL